MMQPSDFWHLLDWTECGRLDGARRGRVHVQGSMRAKPVIILEVPDQEAPQMLVPQHDYLVETFPADTANEALHVRVLPRTPGRNHDLLDAQVPDPLPKRRAVDTVPIAQEIP
jgi:hypothetical protein